MKIRTQSKQPFSTSFAPQLFLRDFLLCVIAASLFVVTQSLLRNGEVTPASVSQWFIAFIPIAIIAGWAFLHRHETRRLAQVAGIVWIVALLLLIVIQALFLGNYTRTFFLEITHYRHLTLIDLAQSFIVATASTLMVMLFLRIRPYVMSTSIPKSQSPVETYVRRGHYLEIFVLTGALYFLFVYRAFF